MLSTVWGNSTVTNMECIHRREKMTSPYITGNFDFINTRGDMLMLQLGLTHFEKRRNYSLCMLMYKAIHGLTPNYISDSLLFSYEVSKRDLRSFDQMNLYLPFPNKQSFKSALSYEGAKMELPTTSYQKCTFTSTV